MKYLSLLLLLGVGLAQTPEIKADCPKGMICQGNAIPPPLPTDSEVKTLPLNSALNAYIEKHCRVVPATKPAANWTKRFGRIKCDQ